MRFRERTLTELADMICGNFESAVSLFPYRTSRLLTEFFRDAGTAFVHDGSTRGAWVKQTLRTILEEPQAHPNLPPSAFSRIVALLMDPEDATNEGPDRKGALAYLNKSLSREGLEVFLADDGRFHLRHIATNATSAMPPSPHRPLSPAEIKRRDQPAVYLKNASEDDVIEEVLLPLFRQLGFHRITVAGHKDKGLEYGKDIWMRFTLPTQHVLYFGLQVKRRKIDASGASDANVAEILNQTTMMLGHEIFDPEIGKRVLVDHAFIVSAGEITKAARNWLGNKLDASKRSQILFMDRDDILNLFIVHNIPLPLSALEKRDEGADEIPF